MIKDFIDTYGDPAYIVFKRAPVEILHIITFPSIDPLINISLSSESKYDTVDVWPDRVWISVSVFVFHSFINLSLEDAANCDPSLLKPTQYTKIEFLTNSQSSFDQLPLFLTSL